MPILEILGISLAVTLLALVALFVRRKLLIAAGGTIRMRVRTTAVVRGRGWSAGIGQFVDDELRFHRMFSFAIRPKRVLNRRGLAVTGRRFPEGPEAPAMPSHWIVLSCTSNAMPIEIAMAESTVTGFLSWLEAGPPGQAGTVVPRPTIAPRRVKF